MDYSQLSFCDTNFWNSPSELDGTGDPQGKPAIWKLDYIHDNPVKAVETLYPEAYHYSSASFYETGVDHFKMLTHYLGWEKGTLRRLMLLVKKQQKRRLMVVALFIMKLAKTNSGKTLVKTVFRLSIPNSNSGKKKYTIGGIKTPKEACAGCGCR